MVFTNEFQTTSWGDFMPNTLLLTFDNNDQRQKFIDLVDEIVFTTADENGKNIQNNLPGWEERRDNGLFIQDVMKNAIKDPLIKDESERVGSLFVSGQKILDGLIQDLNKRFELEVASHSGSVEIKEKRGDEWIVVRRRMKQQR